MKSIGEIFLIHLIDFLDKNSAWNRNSSEIFNSIIKSSKDYFIDRSSAVVKELIDYISKHEHTNVIPIVDCLSLIIENSQSISTFHYSTAFESIILKVTEHSSASGTAILELWIFKADNQSFFRFLIGILLMKTIKNAHEVIFSVCKKKINYEFTKSKCSMSFLQPMLELIYDIITQIKASYDEFLFKVRYK